MRISDSFAIALRGLRHAGMRSLLTMLGIVIGISSVILLMSVGASSQDLILSQVRGLGTNLIFIMPGSSGSSRYSSPQAFFGIVIKTLKQQDIDALRREPSIENVGGHVHGTARIIYGNNDVQVNYSGVFAEYNEIYNLPTRLGNWFTKNDVDSLQHVAILGTDISDTLFGDRNPIGKTVRLKDMSFTVVGVLEQKGLGQFGANLDEAVFIPITVAQKQLLGIDYFSVVDVKARDNFDIGFVRSRIISVLRSNHGITDPTKDDFTIMTEADALSLLGNITNVMSIFLTSIALISLIVGGIGIMNIMLVSVIERTREIGLRKAVGASNRDILSQFLTEAVMITFAGGVVGIVLGAAFSVLAAVVLTNLLGMSWKFILPPEAVILAVVVSTVTGLLFGIYPARQAARKNIIEALRYE